MNPADLAKVSISLQHRRREILEASRRAVTAIDEMRTAQRDPEIVEASQSEQLQFDLSQLGEMEQREIAQIDAALARVEAGAYGICRDCRETIDPSRLAALPFVLDCADCAIQREDAKAVDREVKKRRRIMVPE